MHVTHVHSRSRGSPAYMLLINFSYIKIDYRTVRCWCQLHHLQCDLRCDLPVSYQPAIDSYKSTIHPIYTYSKRVVTASLCTEDYIAFSGGNIARYGVQEPGRTKEFVDCRSIG
jgi:hypothetical protein